MPLTFPMLGLLSSEAQEGKNCGKPLKSCNGGIHWIALADCSQMNIYMPGFQSFYRFLASFCIGILATSSKRVKVSETHSP